MHTTTFKPSVLQQAIFDDIKNDNGSLIIKAVAGSGKTTTIVQCLELIPSSASVLFLAFNKGIAEELKTRVPQGVNVATFHSVGFGAWNKFANRRVQVDSRKVSGICGKLLPYDKLGLYASYVCKLVGLGKNAGIGYLIPNSTDSWQGLINHFDISLESERATEGEAIEIATQVLAESNKDIGTIDFDDMLYLPLINNCSFWKNDFVFIDEAQDTNQVQQALLKRMLKPQSGRLIAVGDDAQAIYGFRGADSQAMNRIATEFNAKQLPLSVSYRCAQNVVKFAQSYVPEIQASETAPLGAVVTLPAYNKATFQPTDAIICRNCAPLVDFAYTLIGQGVGCRILGREIGQGLIALINKLKAKGIDNLQDKLNKWAAREVAKFESKGNEQAAEGVQDKANCINVLIGQLNENNRTIPALIASIETLFSDNNKHLLTLCTAHKSKGLEWKRVFVLDFYKYMPSKWARQEWQKKQERNLIYVAATRAKEQLGFIQSGCWSADAGQQPTVGAEKKVETGVDTNL